MLAAQTVYMVHTDAWVSRLRLEEMGFTKMVNEIDSKEAARLGLQTRPLTTAVIQKHLEDVGIEPEFGTHSRMRGLSGGQKVKVVLAAAMWNNPHILVLDEPTNYLDRESLGALAGAIRNYGGGCLMISHNRGEDPCPAFTVWLPTCTECCALDLHVRYSHSHASLYFSVNDC